MQGIVGAVGLGDVLQIPTPCVQDNVSAGFLLVIPVSRHDYGDLRSSGGVVPMGIRGHVSSNRYPHVCTSMLSHNVYSPPKEGDIRIDVMQHSLYTRELG